MRWGGASQWGHPLSVAQHSLTVLAIREAEGPLTAQEGLRELLHDATEFMLGWDCIAPLKAQLGAPFRQLEARLQAAIDARYQLRIRDMTRRTRGFSLQQLIKELKPYIVGWRGYFGFCQTPRVLTNLEAWIRRRLRLYLWRQWRTRQNRFGELRRRGVAKFPVAVAPGSPTGLWRMSGHPAVQQALRNAYFDSLGLPQIYAPAES